MSKPKKNWKKASHLESTWLQGRVNISYAKLVKVFGAPNGESGYKTDADWDLWFGDVPVTIYNYKDGKNYLGDEGTPTTEICDWHIGGTSLKAVGLVYKALGIKE